MRPAFWSGRVSKQLTPIFGLGFQGMGYINTTPVKQLLMLPDVSLLGKVNLMNLFAELQRRTLACLKWKPLPEWAGYIIM